MLELLRIELRNITICISWAVLIVVIWLVFVRESKAYDKKELK